MIIGIIFLWWLSGGLDWIIDMYECINIIKMQQIQEFVNSFVNEVVKEVVVKEVVIEPIILTYENIWDIILKAKGGDIEMPEDLYLSNKELVDKVQNDFNAWLDSIYK